MIREQKRKEILVYSDSYIQEKPAIMGTLSASVVRGKEVFSFEYNLEFLKSEVAFEIDPNLKLYSGPQYTDAQQGNFGIFLDSSPDRWGRVLMERKEAMNARLKDKPLRRLMESDYLLGVFDTSRMGALRFKTNSTGPFLDNNSSGSIPPMTSLRELEHATVQLEDATSIEDEDYLRRLTLLLAPGSSLGGARPKASVADANNKLWIAKFPSKHDENDTGAWEFITYMLATDCKIDMAASKAEKFYSDKCTFLTKRFDRNANGKRIHFFSAMTLLGYRDGDDAQSGVSYLELADLIQSRGSNVEYDLHQLWRRIVFSIAISNTDDHLKNHGFLLKNNGLTLSPAYDINPNPKGYGLHLNINERDNNLDMEIARSVAPYFRLSDTKAVEIIKEIEEVVSTWKKKASKFGISSTQIDQMRRAFK